MRKMLYPGVHPPPLKKTLQDAAASCLVWCIGPTYFLFNLIAHANSTLRCNKESLFIVIFVAIFNKISPYFCNIRLVALLLIADVSCLMAIQKIVFFFRDGTLNVR